MNNSSFDKDMWKKLVGTTAKAFSMDPARESKLASNKAAELIAALPFLAGSREPERTALAHLASFVLASSEPARYIFDHKKEDDFDPMARLAVVSHFEGGDSAVINRGMKLLAMMVIKGYDRDREKDTKAKAYNPLVAGAWNPEQKLASLKAEVGATPNAAMDGIIDVESALRSPWV
jgi:hypothetical protein